MLQSQRVRHALLVFPFLRSAGYAIDALAALFESATQRIVAPDGRISTAYGDSPPPDGTRPFDGRRWDTEVPTTEIEGTAAVVRERGVDFVLGLDLPARSKLYRPLRQCGVQTIVSYWGAPSSAINHGIKLLAKRCEIGFDRARPDHHVYETEAMRATGVFGRGLPSCETSVVPLGVDTSRFAPDDADGTYAHDVFNIPQNRRLIFYSGHFEERKGVGVLMRAAIHIADTLQRRDLHFVLLGNQDGEADRFRAQIAGTRAEEFVTFGGYRDDLHRLHRSCQLGVLPSIGWDSMTMSSVEMQSSGLPLLVSRLQGLPETIEEGATGFTFTPGDHVELSSRLISLLEDPVRRTVMAARARARAVAHFSREAQVCSLAGILDQICRRRAISR